MKRGYYDLSQLLMLSIHTSIVQKDMFTRVLKGNIGVDSRVFPAGTPGCLLDTFARTALWEVGKNYNHGWWKW